MVTKTRRFTLWSEDEQNIVKLYYKGSKTSMVFIQQVIQDRFKIYRSHDGIRKKAAQLGLVKVVRNTWTTNKIETLTLLAETYNAKEIAQKLRCSLNVVKYQCQKHGISLMLTSRSEWYTKGDLRDILGIDEETIIKLIHSKKIKADKITKIAWRFKKNDVREFCLTYPFELTGRNIDLCQYNEILCPKYGKES